MSSWTIYSKDGVAKATVKELELHDEWMAESYLTISMKSSVPIDFAVDDYIDYRNERYAIQYDPTLLKKARSGSYGEGFSYDNIKFVNEAQAKIVRCDFNDIVLAPESESNKIHYSTLPTFPFYCETVDDLLDRILANLEDLYPGEFTIIGLNTVRNQERGELTHNDTYIEEYKKWIDPTMTPNTDPYGKIGVAEAVDNINCWNALAKVNEDFGLNFILRGYTIIVGTVGVFTANKFRYGKGNGLYEIERVSDSEQQIITRLRAYGSNANLPSRYYANLNMECYGVALADGVGSTTVDIDFKKSLFKNEFNGSEVAVGLRIGSTEYPNSVAWINGVTGKTIINTRTNDPIAKDTKIYFISGINRDEWPVGSRDYATENLPDNMAISRLMLPGFPNKSLFDWVIDNGGTVVDEEKGIATINDFTGAFSKDKYRPYIDSPNTELYSIRPASIYFDGSNDTEDIHPTIEGMTYQGHAIDVITSAEQITDNGVYKEGETVPNFKITLPDLGFDLKEAWVENATINMKDGMCSARAFVIASQPKLLSNGKWECSCKREHDDTLDLWFPYNDFQIKAGDHYVLTGIDMPDVYVNAASERLFTAAIDALVKNHAPRFTFQPRIDELWMQRQHDQHLANPNVIVSLHDTLKSGDVFVFADDDLGIDASIIIDVLTIKENGNNGIATYEITLRDEKQVSPIQKIQNKVEVLSLSGVYGGMGGLSGRQVQSLIDTYGSDRFLSKVNDDEAQGILRFLQSLSVGNALDVGGNAHIIGQTRIDGLLRALANIITNRIESEHYEGGWDNPFGSGFQINERSTDHVSFLSVDNLFVRMKAVFTELEIRKISYAGGNIIFSHAGSRIVSVTPLYDTCDVSFDGTKAVLDGSAEFAGTELQINAGGAFDGTTLKFNDSAQKLVGYRCYLMKDDGTTATENWWRVDDQARCQTFNIDETGTYHNVSNSFYWRRVMAVGTELLEDGKNYDYVDLSIIDAAAGSTVPQAGDTIVQMGNRTDTDRQGFISIQVAGEYAPSFEVYKGVNSYNLSGKRKICISPKYTEIRANKIIESTETGDYPLPHFRTDPWYIGMRCYYYDVVQNNGSSWLCIYPESGIGGVPYTTEEPSKNATYWRIFASEGKEGKTGGETLTVYAWGTSDETAPAISGNAYPPAGWSTRITDRPTGGDYYLWMAETKKDTEGVIADWGIPACISGADGTPGEDAKNIEFIYKYDASGYDGNTGQVSPSGAASGSDTNKQQDDWVPNGWYDRALAVSESNPDVYMSSRKYNASTGTWGAFGTPTLWGHFGEKGIDGDGVQYVYKLFDHELTDAERTSNIPTKPAEPNPQGEWIPTGWSDDPQAPTSSMAFCYCSVIKEINGVWGNFEKLGLWSKWANDGTPGGNTATVMLYKRSASAVTSVGISSTLYYKFSTKKLYTDAACTTEATTQLNGWSLTIPNNSTNQIYVTAAIAFSNTTSDDIASNEWVTPAQFTENGENGEHGINTATVFLYKRSASEITSHGITTTLYYKFTDGKLYTKSGSTYTEATDANLNNWKREIPTGDGNPCYIIQAAALGTEDYDQIATTDWSSVRKLVEDGESPYFADIDEEMDSVALDSDGKTTAAYDNTLDLMLWHGSTAIALTSLSYKVNGSASYTDERTIGNIKVTPNASAKTLRVRVANAATLTTTNEIDITIAGTGSGNKSLHFVLNGIKPGANGDPASVYKLVPSVSSVVKKKDGTYSVQNVSCTCQKVTGSAIADATDGTFTYSVDGGTEQSYTAGTNIAVTSFTKSVKFVYKKGSTVVDRETILMVEDGADGRSITKTSETYRYATNNTGVRPAASSSDWSTTKPTLQKGYWLYTETTITWSDTSTTVLYTDERNPNDGAAGQDIIVDGSTIMKYYVGDSNTTHPAEDSSDWKDLNQVTQTQGKWLWSQATTWYRKSSSASGAHDGGKSVNYNVSYISKDGINGRGVTSVTEYYKANNSTTAPAVDDNQWDTDPNLSHLTDKWDANHIYLWNYEKVTYSSGTTVERTTPQIVAIWTEDGAPGKGIDSIQDYYKITNSLTPPARTDTGWSTSPVAPTAENPYLYNYEAITWVNPSSTTYTAVQMIGHFGKDGNSVEARYAPNANPTSSQIHTTFQDGDEYMSTRVTGGTWSNWQKIVGEDGGETDFSFGISQYKVTANAQTAPSDISSWSDAPVAVTEQKPYLWSKVQQKDGDGNVTSTRYIRLTGEKGIAAAVALLTPQVVSIPVNTSDKVLDEFRQVVPISLTTSSEELRLSEVTILSGGTNVELGPAILESHADSNTTFSGNKAIMPDAHFSDTTLIVDDGSVLVPSALIVKGAKNATIVDHVCEIQVKGYDSEMNEYTAKTSLSIVRNVEGADGPAGANGSDGDNAVNVSLTPQSVILTQNTAGAMPTLTDANTTINVKEGDEDVTSQATIISATPSKYVVSGATYDTCTCSISSKKVIITAIAQHGTETVGEETINKYAEQGYIDIVVRYNGVDTTVRFNFYCNLLGTWKREVVGDAEYVAAQRTIYEMNDRGVPQKGTYDYTGIADATQSLSQWRANKEATYNGYDQRIVNTNYRIDDSEQHLQTLDRVVGENISLADPDGWEQGSTTGEAQGKTYSEIKGDSSYRIRTKELIAVTKDAYLVFNVESTYYVDILYFGSDRKMLASKYSGWKHLSEITSGKIKITDGTVKFIALLLAKNSATGTAISVSDLSNCGLSVINNPTVTSSEFKQTADGFSMEVNAIKAGKNMLKGALSGSNFRCETTLPYPSHPAVTPKVDDNGWMTATGYTSICTSATIEKGKDYALSFYTKYTSAFNVTIWKPGTTTSDWTLYKTLSVAAAGATVRRSVTFNITTADVSGILICIPVTTLRYPQLELGTTATAFEVDSATETSSRISQSASHIEEKVGDCGIDIDEKTITLTAEKTIINGELTVPRVMNENENMVTTCEAGVVKVQSKSTSSYGVFAINSLGEVVLQMYDKDGALVLNLGGTPNTAVNGEWRAVKFKRVDSGGSIADTRENFTATDANCNTYYRLILGTIQNSGSTIQYYLPNGNQTTNPTVIGRNNRVFISNYPTESAIATGTFIPDGYYVEKNDGIFMQEMSDYFPDESKYFVNVYHYESGKITEITKHYF